MRRLTLLALAVAAPAFAQPPARETASVAAPFIDEHTLVVARVDVSRLDVETVLKLAAAIMGEGDEIGEAADAVRASVKKFVQAGGKDVFLTYGPGDFPHLPCLIAPAPEGAHKAVGELLVGLFKEANKEAHDEGHLPTFEIGFSLMLGFVLMFLIDRLPRHATERFQSAPATRHISLDNLSATSGPAEEEEEEGFLGSLTPSPKQSRSLATTTGLVIHAAADGIAMGASATTSNMKLGFIIFVAIMIHKAPAAFGLTSVLLKQGLSKRAARGHLIVFSLAAPFGAIGTFLLISMLGGNMEGPSGERWTGMLLLFSAGTFLYVAMHAMQEDNNFQGHDHHSGMNGYSDGSQNQRKQSKPQMRDTLATVGGMLLPLLTQFGHHH